MAEQVQLSDYEWSRRLGIVCQYPDGPGRCIGCPHYQDPKKTAVCAYDDSVLPAVVGGSGT